MSLKMLVIDSDAATLKLMRTLGTALGHMVLTAEDYDAGAHRAETQRFDLIFMSVGVSEPQAFVSVRRIRRSRANGESTLVVFAPAEDVKTLRMAFSEGVDYVLNKPVAASRVRPMLEAIDSPGWKGKRPSARMPLFTPVKCTWSTEHVELSSMNISESGMLLRPAMDVDIGGEVGLEFSIGEVGATLSVSARVVRKEDKRTAAVEFLELAPENRNAIQLYILGRLKGEERPKDLQGIKLPRWSDG